MQKLSWIYFYHTRSLERSEHCDKDIINYQIQLVQNKIKNELLDMKESNLLSEQALEISQIPEEYLKEYDLIESKANTKN